MENQRFDGMTKRMARTTDRRSMVKAMLGVGAAVTATVAGMGTVGAAHPGAHPAILSPMCVRSCGPDSCGAPDGCGGTCMICSGGRSCLDNGVCVAPCSSDDDCQSGSACMQDTSGIGVCAGESMEDACSATIECPAGTFCDGAMAMCRAIGGLATA